MSVKYLYRTLVRLKSPPQATAWPSCTPTVAASSSREHHNFMSINPTETLTNPYMPHVGDYMAKLYPNSGRILTCQFSVLCGLPLSCLVLKGLPTAAGATAAGGMNSLALTYGVAMLVLGSTISWYVDMMKPVSILAHLIDSLVENPTEHWQY